VGKGQAQGASSVLAALGNEKAHQGELAKGKAEVAVAMAERADVKINRNYKYKKEKLQCQEETERVLWEWGQ